MRKKVSVKAGKGQSMMGFFMGIVFCGIGLFVAIPVFGVFGIFWTIIALAITVMNGINVFSDKGIVTHTIEIDEEIDRASTTHIKTHSSTATIESRFEKLNRLYEQNLITEIEYEQKKSELLKEL